MAKFGYDIIGANINVLPVNYTRFSCGPYVVPPAAVYLQALYVYAASTVGPCPVKAVWYRDLAGLPGVLIATTETDWTVPAAPAWYQMLLPVPLDITALAGVAIHMAVLFETSTPGAALNYNYDTPAGTVSDIMPNAGGNVWDNPWGGPAGPTPDAVSLYSLYTDVAGHQKILGLDMEQKSFRIRR